MPDAFPPRTRAVDSTLALLREGYAFIPNRMQALQTEVFRTRLLFRPVICLQGEAAAALFYESGKFSRARAMPPTTVRLLQDKGSVQTLEDREHRHRKAMFMALLGPDDAARIGALFEQEWLRRLKNWPSQRRVILRDEVQEMLCWAACNWAGAHLERDGLRRRTTEFAAMIDGAGGVGPRAWRGLWLRRRTERWARRLIAEARTDRTAVHQTALHRIAFHEDAGGRRLPPEVAAVELLNLLRPVVAVSRFVEFAALCLHRHPALRDAVSRDETAREYFAQEVRRLCPFFPFIAGTARSGFEWKGVRFRRGDWTILDLYGANRSSALWRQPERFDPDRFRQAPPRRDQLVPQGAGDPHRSHRCPGELFAVELIKRAVKLLAAEMSYDTPPQDFEMRLNRFPARIASGFVMKNIRPAR